MFVLTFKEENQNQKYCDDNDYLFHFTTQILLPYLLRTYFKTCWERSQSFPCLSPADLPAGYFLTFCFLVSGQKISS